MLDVVWTRWVCRDLVALWLACYFGDDDHDFNAEQIGFMSYNSAHVLSSFSSFFTASFYVDEVTL